MTNKAVFKLPVSIIWSDQECAYIAFVDVDECDNDPFAALTGMGESQGEALKLLQREIADVIASGFDENDVEVPLSFD